MLVQPTRYYEFEINNKIIEYRTWKTKDEKEFLILRESKPEINDNDVFEYLVKPCMKDPTIELTQGERQMLILEIRKKSFGDGLVLQFICTECKQVNVVEFHLSKIIEYKAGKFEPVIFDGITVEFTASKEVVRDIPNAIERNFENFLDHVKSIKIGEEFYNNIARDDLREFFDNMDAQSFDHFFQKLLEQNEEVTYNTECACMFCQSKQFVDLGDIPNLFPW